VKKKWLEEQLLDLIATNLIPGPNSTEMAIHIGHERAGWKGPLQDCAYHTSRYPRNLCLAL
jgi:chromate transport protein ChrA